MIDTIRQRSSNVQLRDGACNNDAKRNSELTVVVQVAPQVTDLSLRRRASSIQVKLSTPFRSGKQVYMSRLRKDAASKSDSVYALNTDTY